MLTFGQSETKSSVIPISRTSARCLLFVLNQKLNFIMRAPGKQFKSSQRNQMRDSKEQVSLLNCRVAGVSLLKEVSQHKCHCRAKRDGSASDSCKQRYDKSKVFYWTVKKTMCRDKLNFCTKKNKQKRNSLFWIVYGGHIIGYAICR